MDIEMLSRAHRCNSWDIYSLFFTFGFTYEHSLLLEDGFDVIEIRPCAGSGSRAITCKSSKRAVTELHFQNSPHNLRSLQYHPRDSRQHLPNKNFQIKPATKLLRPLAPTPAPVTPPQTSHNHGLRRNPHLVTGWHVDQAIMSEEDRLVVIRFGRDWDPDCMRQDEVLYKIADRVKNFAVIYVCDLDQVPDFKQMYELYDTVTMMFFFRNKHMMCDFGTSNNNKLNWVLEDKQELIDIIETIYKGAKKGRGLVVSPKDYSTRYRY